MTRGSCGEVARCDGDVCDEGKYGRKREGLEGGPSDYGDKVWMLSLKNDRPEELDEERTTKSFSGWSALFHGC